MRLVMPHQISGCCTLSGLWSNAISVCISAASFLQVTWEDRGGEDPEQADGVGLAELANIPSSQKEGSAFQGFV